MRDMRIPVLVALGISIVFVVASIMLRDRGEEGLLHVTFFDVGQGDAIFIESPSGVQVLIDGGKGNQVLRGLQKTMGFFDRDIDMVVATHPDLDHIGGLIEVLRRYRVHTILMTENISASPTFEAFVSQVTHEHAQIVYARRGQVFDFGSGIEGSTTLSILFPDHDPHGLESNTSSIVAQLVYGESEFLFTGDSPQGIEEYLVQVSSTSLRSDVLKAGHHGSRTSSSEVFVRAVAPMYGIFSAGKDNPYGHPHQEVVDLFTTLGITQKNTANLGSISSVSDGVSVWFK